MTIARNNQISLADTPYYHCVSRCVRRAFLCGRDALSGKNYDHRKQWIVDKLAQLSSVFAIDICAYAVMSNHYHVVLRVNAETVLGWSDDEVIARWCQLFKGPDVVQRYLIGEALNKKEHTILAGLVAQWRDRLIDLSWYMRCLNEGIARQANLEDGCKGRFWEGRFRSQALLDEAALLSCMMYVDLNPLRAGVATTPEGSDFTSIQARIQAYVEDKKQKRKRGATTVVADVALLPFADANNDAAETCLPFQLKDYLDLADWTGRAVRVEKSGAIPSEFKLILERLQIDERQWLPSVKHFGRRFCRAAGTLESLQRLIDQLEVSWLKGIRAAFWIGGVVPAA